MAKRIKNNMKTADTGFKGETTGLDVLNAIRNTLPANYKNRIPVATQESLAEYGTALKEFPVIMNSWVNILINKIGLTVIKNKMWNNKLAEFQRGNLPVGSTIEEIFIDLVKAKTYTEEPASDNLGDVFAVNKPDVKARFHIVNSRLVYPISVSKANLIQAFNNIASFEDFISKLFESVYASANLDEYLQTKQLIQTYKTKDEINRFYDVKVDAVTDEDSAKAFATKVRAYSNKIEFMKTDFNYAHVTTHTPKEDQVLLINSDVEAYMDVNVLAYAFNMEKADPSAIINKVVTLDDFGDEEDTETQGILVDRDWFMIYDQLYQMEEQNNALHLYYNRFLHVWKVYSTSEFANAVRFTTNPIEPKPEELIVEPAEATVVKGGTQQFTTNTPVTWEIQEQVAEGTSITEDGLLTISAEETAEEITILASATEITAETSITVTITAPAENDTHGE